MSRLVVTTALIVALGSVGAEAQDPVTKGNLEAWLLAHDRAFTAKKVDDLEAFYTPNATVIEEGRLSRGWAEYRDRHLAPSSRPSMRRSCSARTTRCIRSIRPTMGS